MYAEKQQGIIYFKAKDEQKGLKIDLATGIVTSQTSGQPYKSQFSNHLRKLFVGQPIPEIFNTTQMNILETTEPIALVALYWHLNWGERQHYVDYATTLQMIYNRQFEMRFHSVIRLHKMISLNKLDRSAFINFIIQENIHEIELSNINDFAIAQSGINITNLTDNQRRIVRTLVERNIDREKIKYIIRKIVAEHIEYVIDTYDIIKFFHLADELGQSYNQKNFLNGYASMRYLYEMNREALMQEKVLAAQKDIFKLDTDDFYCVMPTTPKEFSDMGRKMSNCIAGYYEGVAVSRGQSIIVFVYDRHTNEPIINMEIGKRNNGQYFLKQFLGKQNSYIVHEPKYQPYYTAYQVHLQTINPQ